MGDVRYSHFLERVREAHNASGAIRDLPDEGVICALAAASRERDPYLANVLAVEALNRSHRNARILATAGDAIFVVDRAGRLTYMNPAAEGLTGWTQEAALGLPAGEKLHESGRKGLHDWWECPVVRVLQDGATVTSVEDVIHRRDGASIPVSYTATPILRDGDVDGAVVIARDIRSRKRAAALREQMAAALRASMDGMAILDEGGRYVYVNEAHARIYGHDDPGDFIGETWRALYNPDEVERFDREVFPQLREKGCWRGEARGRRRDGTPFPQEISLSRIEGGGIVCVVRDVSERKHDEDRLRASEEKWRSLVENAPLIIVIIDEDGQILYINRVRGDHRKEDVVGSSVYDYVPPDERPVMEAAFQDTWETGEPAWYEIRGEGPGNRTAWYHTTVSPIRWKNEVVSLLLLATDITEHKMTETRLARVAETVAEGLIITDREGHITYANAEAARIGGHDRDALAGRCFNDPEWALTTPDGRLVPAEDLPNVRVLSTGRPATGVELAFTRPDGERVVISVNAAPLRDPSGRIEGVLSTFHDVTDRVRAEEEADALRQRLEERVEERTRALRSANEELEAFSYSASHDLRAPLRGIEFYSRVLAEDFADAVGPDGREYLERLRGESNRLTNLINDLLVLSRVGRADVRGETVELTRMARDVLRELQRSDPARAVEVTVEEGVEAFGDPVLLRVVLENLLGNAWKFTRGREPARIVFGCEEVNEEAAYFVRDNGVGFEPSDAASLFQPFRRLHPASRFEGTGIGLATVKRIVERHGGRVWAEGEAGEGATFWFTLPHLE